MDTTNKEKTCATKTCGTIKGCKKISPISIVIVVLLIANLIVNFISLEKTSEKAIRDIEVMKIGGEENYDIRKKIMNNEKYKEFRRQELDMTLMQLNQTEEELQNQIFSIPEQTEEVENGENMENQGDETYEEIETKPNE